METSPVGTSPEIDVEVAAATVNDILETSQRVSIEPGACPYGPTTELALLLPAQAQVTPAMRAGDVDDDGQVYFGDPEIIYCPIGAADASTDNREIDEFRVDVAFGTVDVIAYLDQNFETVEASDLVSRPNLLGGEVVVVCHFDGCTGTWQLDDLFLAVTLIDGDEPLSTADDAEAALAAMAPVVVERLTTLGNQRTELAALAESYWSDIYDEAAWDGWDAMVLAGDTESYPLWMDYELEEGTITSEQSEELLDLLNALPGQVRLTD